MWLEGDEIDQLEPIIKSRGWVPLNKAMCRVLAAFDADGKKLTGTFMSQHDNKFTYTVGKRVTAKLDSDVRVECTSGIHFFITRLEAEDYN